MAEVVEPKRRRPIRDVISWLFGSAILLVAGSGLLIALSSGPNLGGLVAALGGLIGALLLLPPGIAAFRRKGVLLSTKGHVIAVLLALLASGEAGAWIENASEHKPKPVADNAAPAPQRATSAYGRPPDPTALLKPATRFSEAGTGSILRPTQDALNSGDVMKAVELFHSLPVTAADRGSPVGKRLRRSLDRAFAQISGGQSNGSVQVETLETYWRPKLDALSISPPTNPEETGHRVSELNELALALHDSEGVDLTPTERRQRNRFRADLSAKQAKLFPLMRRTYAKQLGASLWQANGQAAVAARGARTLILTSPFFLANAAVAQIEGEQEAVFRKLRFERVEYRSYPGSKYVFYDLHSPSDTAIGDLEGSRFVAVQ